MKTWREIFSWKSKPYGISVGDVYSYMGTTPEKVLYVGPASAFVMTEEMEERGIQNPQHNNWPIPNDDDLIIVVSEMFNSQSTDGNRQRYLDSRQFYWEPLNNFLADTGHTQKVN
jgi:hypothetical protein